MTIVVACKMYIMLHVVILAPSLI